MTLKTTITHRNPSYCAQRVELQPLPIVGRPIIFVGRNVGVKWVGSAAKFCPSIQGGYLYPRQSEVVPTLFRQRPTSENLYRKMSEDSAALKFEERGRLTRHFNVFKYSMASSERDHAYQKNEQCLSLKVLDQCPLTSTNEGTPGMALQPVKRLASRVFSGLGRTGGSGY